MSAACGTCGVTLAPGSQFCHACGATQGTRSRFGSPIGYTPPHLVQRILRHRSALEGERKRVTVLFCDLVGSTRLAGTLGPEAMHELLNGFFDAALEVVHLYEGTINQFLGDGFMALFGAPLAIEHHERQALLAAAALRDGLTPRLREAVAHTPLPVALRVGVNTGVVVVGKIGDNLRMDYTAVGDTTNVAARLQIQAEPSAILASAATFDRVRTWFTGEPLGPLAVAGRDEPVVAYRIVGQLPSRSTLDAGGERPLSRFVGRHHDLEALADALAQAEQELGQVVGVIGDAGLGKSRLLAEFRRSLAGRRLTWLEGRCVPYGVAIPYLPVLDLLRANCRIVDTDTPEAIATKLAHALGEVGMDATSAAPYLLHLLGVKEGVRSDVVPSPDAVKGRTLEILRELALRGGRLRPIVFVVEDLHWIDPASLEFLVDVADVLAGASILLLVTYRPGYAPPWAGKSYATQIALRPLAEADSLAVIESSLGATPVAADARRTIAARGEGNPLFLEELARALLEQGDAAAGEQIPNTLHGLLMSRIDRLDDEIKRALQVASVIGREFSTDVLEAVWGGSGSLPDHLRELARHEFLRQRRRGDDPSYVFKHALTRDIVYGSLLARHRRHYHTAVALALERLHAGRIEEVVEVVAHHFGLSDDDGRAIDYAIRAMAKARRRGANAEALVFAEAARARLATMPEDDDIHRRRIDLVIQEAEVRFALGRHAEQIAALEEIRGLVAALDDPSRRAAWHYWMGYLHSLTGSRPEVALEYCREAARIAEGEGLHELSAYADTCLAQTYVFMGDLDAAVAACHRALAAFERRGDLWWAARALTMLSASANARGDWEESLAHCAKTLDYADRLDDRRLRISALVRTAATRVQGGESTMALSCCDDALALGPSPFDQAAINAVRGYALVRHGDSAAGLAELDKARRWYEQSAQHYTRTQFGVWRAEALLGLGDRVGAREAIDEVLTVSDKLGYSLLRAVGERLFGEWLAADDPAGARVRLEAAAARLDAMGARAEAAKARAAMSTWGGA